MQKAFLISLRFSNIVGYNNVNMPMTHLGILCLREVAKQYGLDVEVLDGDSQNIVDDEIIDILLEAKPQVIGFSPFQNTMERTIKIIKTISVHSPKTIIILGGVHASIMSSEIMHDIPEVDYIIKGEAESAFPNLLLKFFNNQTKDLSEIDGLVYRSNGGILENKPRIFTELDSLPNLGLSQVLFKKEISLIASRGCVSNCSFCCAPAFMRLTENNKQRYQSPEKVIQDIEEILKISNNGKLTINFNDDDFISLSEKSIKRAEDIADYLLSKGISVEIGFSCQAKAIVKAGKEFWMKWKQAGLGTLFCGFESGSDEDLKYYNKSSNLADAIEAYKILNECGIYFLIGFIMFNPYSDKERLVKNIDFLKYIGQLHQYRNTTNQINPFPATRIFHDLEKENLLTFEKPYLPKKIIYKNKFIEKVRSEICLYRDTQLKIDSFCFNFDYAIPNNKKTIEFDKTVLKLDNDLCSKYSYYKNLRAEKIEFFINKMLNGTTSDLSDIGKEMNNSLLKIHKEFVSNILIKVPAAGVKKPNKFSSILSLLKIRR